MWNASRFVLVVAIFVAVLYLYRGWNSEILNVISSGLPSLFSFAATAIACMALLRSGIRRGDRWTWIWACATLAMFLVFVGELADAFYSLVLVVPIPVPSIADLFFFAAYPFFLWVLLSLIWPFRGALSLKDLALGSAIPVFVALVLVSVLLPFIARQHMTLGLVVSLAYPLLDLIVLCIVIPTAVVFREGALWRPARFVILGITLILAADMLVGYVFLSGMGYPTPSHPFEILFLWGYLALALGFYLRLGEPWT